MALRTDASGPGTLPANTAETVRSRSTRKIWLSVHTETRRSRNTGIGRAAGQPDQLDQIIGRRPHAPQGALAGQRDPLVAQGDFGQSPPTVLRPDEVIGGDADIIEEHLVEGVLSRHVDQRADLDPRRIHGADEVGDARVLGRPRIGPGQQDAPLGDVGVTGPDLLAVDHPVGVGRVAVTLGPGRQRRPDRTRRRAR